MNRAANFIKKIWQKIGTPEFVFFFVAVWTAVVMFGGIRFGDLSGYDDAAYAHEAKTMLQTNDWWTLSLNGAPDFDKPPLFIWLLALSFKIFGANDFAAKIPGVLLGWATVILVYFLAKEIVSDKTDASIRRWLPPAAMLSMATTQYFLKYSSHAMTDVPFTFFFALAVYFYLRALKNSSFLLASGAAIGFATLTRSPMGLFPLGIIVAHLVFIRRYKLLFSFQFAACVLIAASIAATWYLQEYNLFGDVFTTRHFANIFGHSASEKAATRNGLQQFLWYFEYLFLIVKLYVPWFPLMFYGLFLAARKVWTRLAPVESLTAEILLIVWLVVVLTPFSLAESKVLRYILPVFPAFAVLSAYALCHLLSLKRLPNFARFAVLLLAMTAFLTTAFPHYLTRAEDMHTLAPVSDAATEPDEKILLYTSGDWQANYQTQLLWYGNRLCVHLLDIKEIEKSLSGGRQIVVIMDKPSFVSFAGQTKATIKILSESENFVCFRAENSL